MIKLQTSQSGRLKYRFAQHAQGCQESNGVIIHKGSPCMVQLLWTKCFIAKHEMAQLVFQAHRIAKDAVAYIIGDLLTRKPSQTSSYQHFQTAKAAVTDNLDID